MQMSGSGFFQFSNVGFIFFSSVFFSQFHSIKLTFCHKKLVRISFHQIWRRHKINLLQKFLLRRENGDFSFLMKDILQKLLVEMIRPLLTNQVICAG
jgi:hypothetical protein